MKMKIPTLIAASGLAVIQMLTSSANACTAESESKARTLEERARAESDPDLMITGFHAAAEACGTDLRFFDLGFLALQVGASRNDPKLLALAKESLATAAASFDQVNPLYWGIAMGRMARARELLGESCVAADYQRAVEVLRRQSDEIAAEKLSADYQDILRWRTDFELSAEEMQCTMVAMRAAFGDRPKVDVYVNFQKGSSELDDRARRQADEMGKAFTSLAKSGNKRFNIIGHTDAVGDDNLNQALSEARATSVVRYIESQFPILKGQLSGSGKGEREPLAPGCDNVTGYGEDGECDSSVFPANRRVELVELDN